MSFGTKHLHMLGQYFARSEAYLPTEPNQEAFDRLIPPTCFKAASNADHRKVSAP
jgi:hypothetical protein